MLDLKLGYAITRRRAPTAATAAIRAFINQACSRIKRALTLHQLLCRYKYNAFSVIRLHYNLQVVHIICYSRTDVFMQSCSLS